MPTAAPKPAASAAKPVPTAPATPVTPPSDFPILHQSECLGHFGNPFSAGFRSKWLVDVQSPYLMHMGGVPIHNMQINREAAASLLRVLNHVWDVCGRDPGKIAAIHADQWSGTYNPRNMRGLNAISMHAYGLAIDFDAPHNALHATNHFFQRGNPLVDAFLAERWTWGGDWQTRPDAMHFQRVIVG